MPPKRQLNASASDEPRRSARASVKPSLLLDESGGGKEADKPAQPAKKAKMSVKPKKTVKETASKAKPAKSATKAQPKAAVKKAPAKKAAKKEAPAKKAESEEKPSDASDESKDSAKLKVGDMLPEITLKDQSGADVNLHAVAQESGLVIFSYPAASTPGCTSQACSYRDEYAAITGKGFKVYGLSTDTVNVWTPFD
ncbi:thioredoxin-like protein [Protomyces lactucae-debilis]|uniref:Thioredoxin-like protein n=1 Tax=Protomyces lactucae-debilis TaxID=2754530 RepID=A0A1Y2F434_PROLT|nr:thioredoxin-like protein [Protomyces lactucae-debilis]ORY78613.1 thioredoxin-like protein [Protomyces lactucae-debilis]